MQIIQREIKTKSNSIAKIEKLGTNSEGVLSIICNGGVMFNLRKAEVLMLRKFIDEHYPKPDIIPPAERPKNNTKVELTTTNGADTTFYLDERDVCSSKYNFFGGDTA
jgi:hypothetical protein